MGVKRVSWLSVILSEGVKRRSRRIQGVPHWRGSGYILAVTAFASLASYLLEGVAEDPAKAGLIGDARPSRA